MATALPVASIRRDGGTQVRAALDEEHVSALTEHLRGGGAFADAVVVFYDGTDRWLGDGFHRVEACARVGQPSIAADVRAGTQRDAQLFACGANAQHTGLRRTNADKRRAVETLLRDAEWAKWSDREIARRCGVSNNFASAMRGAVTVIEGQSPERKGADGRTINTVNIGKSPRPAKPAPVEAIDPMLEDLPASPKVSENAFQMDTARTVERGGKTYQQDTANIGKTPRAPKAAPVDVVDPMLEDLPEEEGDVIEATERPRQTASEDDGDHSFGDLDEGTDSTRIVSLCKAFESELARHLSKRPLATYRNDLYRNGAEGALMRLQLALAEFVKPKAPVFGVIRGGK